MFLQTNETGPSLHRILDDPSFSAPRLFLFSCSIATFRLSTVQLCILPLDKGINSCLNTPSAFIIMVLYVIGLGLGDEKDITVRGLELVKSADYVFLEHYTSILGGVSKERLEEFYGKEVLVADRGLVENDAEDLIIQPALEKKVAFLVVGDPVCATTHTDLIIRAKEIGVQVEMVHNASIMGASGACGLQLYNFGHTVSIPFFNENWRPTSFYPKIQYNRKGGMHTLCLLDIKVKEPDFQAMMKGRTEFLPPRYMSVSCAAEQLIEAEETHGEGAYDVSKTLCVGLARMGQPTQKMVAGTLEELVKVDMGEPLHSMIICGELHDLELEILKEYLIEGSTYDLESHKKPATVNEKAQEEVDQDES
jgi:diphthine synthase